MSHESPERKELYVIPAGDLSNMKYRGNTKISINPDKNEICFAYLSGKEEVSGSDGKKHDIRIGYVSRFALNNNETIDDGATALSKQKVSDIIEFSQISFNPKKS